MPFALTVLTLVSLSTLGNATYAKTGGGGRGGGGDDGGGFIPVCVSFRDANPWYDPNGADIDRIQSDSNGVYCHDKRTKVQAEIDTNGGFRFDTGGQRGPRKVWLDFSDQAFRGDPGSDDLIPSPGLAGADIRIHDEYYHDGSGWVSKGPLNLIEMLEGESTYVGLTRGPLIKFDPNPPGDAFDTGIASPVVVTRVSSDMWVFESFPSDIAASFKVVDNDWDNPVFLGFFHMPFRLTVAILP